jgi:hypothetical protein
LRWSRNEQEYFDEIQDVKVTKDILHCLGRFFAPCSPLTLTGNECQRRIAFAPIQSTDPLLRKERGGPTMFARFGVMRAFNRNVERTFNSSRNVGAAVRARRFPICRLQKAENLASCTASSATQCRSNPLSYRSLPKTGIFQISAGDYRGFRAKIV